VVDIRHTGELVDRKAAIPIADRARSDDRWWWLDVSLGVRDRRGRTRAASRGPIFGEAFGPLSCFCGLLCRSRCRRTCGGGGRPARPLHKLARRGRDDERFRTHCGFAWGRDLSRDDGVVRHELVLETSFVCAIPRRLEEDAELFRRL